MSEAESQTAPSAAPVPRATAVVVAMVVVAALAIGLLGGVMFSGWTEGPADVEQQPLDPGNVESRAGDLEGDPQRRPTETEPTSDPETGNVPETSPADDAFAARLAEEEARLVERARLASDSPLTPAVTETADLVERWRPEEPEPVPTPAAAPTALPGAVPGSAPAPQDAASQDFAPRVNLIDGGAPTHVLARGSVIPTVLESLIDSDLPGLVRAKVAETVYDTVTGRHMLIPRGSWLVGTYGSNTSGGQRRLFVSWTDLRLPDGTPIPLGGTGSLGVDGASGVKGRRSTGLWTALGAAVLFDLAGNASQILIAAETGEAPGRQGGLAEILGVVAGNSTAKVAERYLGEILKRGARFRVDAGARMNVLVEEDLHLPAQPAPGGWR